MYVVSLSLTDEYYNDVRMMCKALVESVRKIAVAVTDVGCKHIQVCLAAYKVRIYLYY